jgi:hypothetical protein
MKLMNEIFYLSNNHVEIRHCFRLFNSRNNITRFITQIFNGLSSKFLLNRLAISVSTKI